ncbi:MAG: acetoin utilization protein AcuC [Candidatus Thorarchaeota archaeon]
MGKKLIYPWSDALLQYEFKKDHPLKPDRLRLTYELSKALGLIKKVEVIEPIPATREDLEMFHTPEFIDAVIEVSKTGQIDARHGLGIPDNPIFPRMYDAAARYVGATLEAMKSIERGSSMAFAISGGLHHAHQNEASGFCIFNDVVTSIMHLQRKKSCRVLYFDFDAHHGDGVQNAFYHSKDVMTISVHQTGKTLFPGTGYAFDSGVGDGVGYSVNVPLLPGAGDIELIRVMEEVVKPLFESYKPDLLVTQMGVDGHFLDPLAHLTYTTHGYETILKDLRKLSSDICRIGWLGLGGGGYHPVNVARLWTLFLALMLDTKIPNKIPESFNELCLNHGYSDSPGTMRDEIEVVQQYNSRQEVELDLDRAIRRVREEVFPYNGLF